MRRVLRETPADSAPVRAAVATWLNPHPAIRTVAVFAALPGEVDLAPLVALETGRRWVYPRVDGDLLTFHAIVDPATGLVPGAFGIAEPAAGADAVPIGEIDTFLCPGLAFDPRGGRLGRGRGFYDRILAAARPDALRIGVCFPFQRVPDTFAEAHDIRMDLVLS